MDDIDKECRSLNVSLFQCLADFGPNDIEMCVGQLLFALGFKSKLEGTQFLRRAIVFVYDKGEDARISYGKEVYVAVAEKMGISPHCVERAIHNTIADCDVNGNLRTAGQALWGDKKVDYTPSNAEFISAIVEFINVKKPAPPEK